ILSDFSQWFHQVVFQPLCNVHQRFLLRVINHVQNLIQHFVPVHQCEGPLVDKLERNIMCISNFGYFFFQMSDLWLQQSYIILIGFFFKLPSPTCMSLKINTAVFCRLLYFFASWLDVAPQLQRIMSLIGCSAIWITPVVFV